MPYQLLRQYFTDGRDMLPPRCAKTVEHPLTQTWRDVVTANPATPDGTIAFKIKSPPEQPMLAQNTILPSVTMQVWLRTGMVRTD